MKKRKCRYIICLFIWAIIPSLCFGQGLIVDFSYDKSTYLWQDSIWYDKDITNSISLKLSNRSTATLIEKSLFIDQADRWQKDANSNLKLTFNRQKSFSWGLTAHNNYSRLEDRKVTINQLGGHQSWQVFSFLEMTSALAYSETSRRRTGMKDVDKGLQQKLDLNYSQNFFDLGRLRLSYEHDLNLLKRTPEKKFGFKAGFNKIDLSRQIRLNYSGNYRTTRFFSELASFDNIAIQDRYEHLGDLLISFYPFEKLKTDLISSYVYRRFDYRSESQASSSLLGRDNLTSSFHYNLRLNYPLFEFLHLSGEYIFRRSDEEFGGLFSGQIITLGEVRMASDWLLGKRDSIHLSGTFSVTSYEGKQDNNLFSDRDRAYRLGRMVIQHRFTRHLIGRLIGSYQYIHDIYVSSQLSANNNHNELYILQPELTWRPYKFLQIEQSWLMHANYIWYDFEKLEDSDRNTLYRKAGYLVKGRIIFSPALMVVLSYRYRFEDYGQLIYRDQWAQRISWERRGSLPSFELKWRPFKPLFVDAGYSYERKHSFDHLPAVAQGETILEEKELFKRQKIYINIGYRPSEKSDVRIEYTRRVQESLQFSDEDSDIVTVNISRFF
jgi:hypothetical protein